MMKKAVSLVLAYLFLALAIIGVVLPGLPTVPFLLLAAWFAARGSERLHAWLYAHPHFGQLLIDWEQQKAVSRKSKVLAIIMMAASAVFLCYKTENTTLVAVVVSIFVCVSTYLLTRPEPTRNARPHQSSED
jgi:uncharacterized membrane protein YbaN (DUF454 family)